MPNENLKLVYSTDQPVLKKKKPTKIKDHPVLPSAEQKVTVRHDRKRRGGKSVTVIEGIQMPKRLDRVLFNLVQSMYPTQLLIER